MKCLAIYGWESHLEIDFLYDAMNKHLGNVSHSLKDVNVIIDGWPRAKRVSDDNLLKFLSQPERLRSIDGELKFYFDKGDDVGTFLISSMPRLFFVGLPRSIEQIAGFDVFVRHLAEHAKFSYGYTFQSVSDKPALYASGITYVEAGKSIDKLLAEEDERWFNVLISGNNGCKNFVSNDVMRGVYELNILNDQHIERKIDNEDFLSLVKRKNWGSLTKISSYNWLWQITGTARTDAENYLRRSSVFI